MPKAGQRVEVNSFIQGLITEASPLNFPANASKDEENFVLNTDGSRDRRLGMDYESGYVIRNAPAEFTNTLGTNTYRWSNVNGIAGLEILVVQLGRTLVFYDVSKESISAQAPMGSYTTGSTYGYTPEIFPDDIKYSFTNVHGYLVVVGGIGDILSISYDPISLTFKAGFQRIFVRDFWGIEVKSPPEGLYPEGSPYPNGYESDESYRGPANQNHFYNLRNQSWGIPRRGDPSFISSDPIDIFYNTVGKYPSNSEAVWTALQYQAGVGGADPFERIYPKLYNEKLGSDNLSAKGYFVIDLLRRGVSRSLALTTNNGKYPDLTSISPTILADTTMGGATVATEFSGRVFYSGFGGKIVDGDNRSPDLSSFVLFSTLVTSPQDIGKCYQKGDPTSRDTPELIDTDGGFIRIAGARNIIAMEHMGASLVVIADNGVWSITGGADNGFSATNYKVSKISSNGGCSKTSVIRDGENVLYWALDAIYAISKTQYGDLTVTPLTITTIQKLYNNIPSVSKKASIGAYDASNRKARWVYKDVDGISDLELVFDLTLKAFYKNRISQLSISSPSIYGIFTTTSFGTAIEEDIVMSDLDVVLSDTDTVTIPSTARTSGVQSTKYLFLINTGSGYQYGFSSYNNPEFKDWKSRDGVGTDAKAFIETGAQCSGDSGIDKQIPYLIMHFRQTETGIVSGIVQNQSSCKVKSMWDWGYKSSTISAPLFQTYRINKANIPLSLTASFSKEFEVVTTKSKVRGRGKAFALYLETEPLKDCRILGWNITQNANTIT